MRCKVFLAVLFLVFLIGFVPAPHLTSVSWNMTEVAEGQPVRLNVAGDGLDGHQISFEVFERDAGGTNDDVLITPPNIVYHSPDSYATWIAEYQDDTDEGQTNPPEYYFNATVVGTSSYMESSTADADMLKVNSLTNCDLTSAEWNMTEAVEGQPVRLNVDGIDCNGKTITFEVREDDFLSSDFVANPLNIIFGSPDTYVNWIVKWVDDSGGLQENPPEYYFIAGVEGTSETLTSSRNNEDLIKVYEWSLMCLGVNHCADYSEGAFCRYDLCNVGENSAPKKITCGETFNPITGCNESTNCGCDWNVGLGVCESEWSSESDCPAGTLEIGTCSYTENSEDTCDDDGLLTRSLTALWEWSPLNPTHSDPSGVEDKCINVQEILPCPASAQVPFFGIYQLVIVITILGLIYLLTHKKQIKNKRRKKKNK